VPGQVYSGTSRPVDATIEVRVRMVAIRGSNWNISYAGLYVNNELMDIALEGPMMLESVLEE